MADNKPIQKILKPVRLIYAFLKWTAAVLSLLLLGVGLLLAVPWKISLVFAVIPTVTIFMPRDLQKWFWIALAIIIIAVYIWIRSPEHNASQWRPYVFEKRIDKYLYKGQIPDFMNAAIQYDALFARHEEDVFFQPIDEQTELATYLQPWEEIDQPELAQWMKTLEPDIAVFMDIAQMPECHFEPPVDIRTLNAQFKRLNIHKAFVRVLVRSSNQDIRKGLSNEALHKKLAVLQSAQHLWRQTTLLDQAAGYFLERMGRRALSRFVVMTADDFEILEQIEQDYERLDSGWPDSWRKILNNEKMLAVGLSGMFYQNSDQGHIRYNRNLAEGLRQHMGARFSKHALPPEMARMLVLLLGFSIPAEPDGTAYLIEKRFNRLSQMVSAGIDLETKVSQRWWEDGLNASAAIDWYACRQVAYYYPLNNQDIQFQQNRAVMKILIALKRYWLQNGCWPDSLGQIFIDDPEPMDPIRQKSFIYQKQIDGFKLYSIGQNGIDDGGIKNSYAKPVQDDTLFWPAASISNGEEQNEISDTSVK